MTGKRVLVVEDEPITAMDESEILTSLGHSVTTIVFTGEDAVRRAGKDRPDVVLMDIKLIGKMDGIVAAREIRNRYGIPVVFVTAYGNKELSASSAMNVPSGYGYVVKPFTREDIRRGIDRAVQTSEQDHVNGC